VLDFLFGEGQYGLRFLFAFIVVLGLIGLTAWLVRRFGATHLGATAARGRQPRLAVIDAAAVDGRRRLVLIRRDNVEHLLMIGGPTDVVIEPNIVRAAAARDVPARLPAAADTLPRPVPLGEPDTWAEPALPPPAAARRANPQPIEEPQVPWPAEPEPQQMPRQTRAVDPLAGLAAELSRNPPEPAPALAMPRVVGRREAAREPAREPMREQMREPTREPMREPMREPPREAPREVPREHPREVAREPVREPIREVVREPMREPVREPMREVVREPMMREAVREPMRETARAHAQQAPAAEVPFAPSADQNLAEMAQRLEAALRRPVGKGEVRTEVKPRAVPEPVPMAEPSPLEPAPVEARRDAKPAPQRSPYDSLEQEMASLLGRPGSKA
jgi:flagellar protein FliO/FliZ